MGRGRERERREKGESRDWRWTKEGEMHERKRSMAQQTNTLSQSPPLPSLHTHLYLPTHPSFFLLLSLLHGYFSTPSPPTPQPPILPTCIPTMCSLVSGSMVEMAMWWILSCRSLIPSRVTQDTNSILEGQWSATVVTNYLTSLPPLCSLPLHSLPSLPSSFPFSPPLPPLPPSFPPSHSPFLPSPSPSLPPSHSRSEARVTRLAVQGLDPLLKIALHLSCLGCRELVQMCAHNQHWRVRGSRLQREGRERGEGEREVEKRRRRE